MILREKKLNLNKGLSKEILNESPLFTPDNPNSEWFDQSDLYLLVWYDPSQPENPSYYKVLSYAVSMWKAEWVTYPNLETKEAFETYKQQKGQLFGLMLFEDPDIIAYVINYRRWRNCKAVAASKLLKWGNFKIQKVPGWDCAHERTCWMDENSFNKFLKLRKTETKAWAKDYPQYFDNIDWDNLKESLELNESPLFTPSQTAEVIKIDDPSVLWKIRCGSDIAVVRVPTFKRTFEFVPSSASTYGGGMTGYRDIYFLSEQDAQNWLDEHQDRFRGFYVQKAARNSGVKKIIKIRLYDDSEVWINPDCLPKDPENIESSFYGHNWYNLARNATEEEATFWWKNARRKWPEIFGTQEADAEEHEAKAYRIRKIINELGDELNLNFNFVDQGKNFNIEYKGKLLFNDGFPWLGYYGRETKMTDEQVKNILKRWMFNPNYDHLRNFNIPPEDYIEESVSTKSKLELNESPLFAQSENGNIQRAVNPSSLFKLRDDNSRVACVNVPGFKRTFTFRPCIVSTAGGAMTQYRDMYFTRRQDAQDWLDDHHDQFEGFTVRQASSSSNVGDILEIELDDGTHCWISLNALPRNPYDPDVNFERTYCDDNTQNKQLWSREKSKEWWDKAEEGWPDIFRYEKPEGENERLQNQAVEQALQRLSDEYNIEFGLEEIGTADEYGRTFITMDGETDPDFVVPLNFDYTPNKNADLLYKQLKKEFIKYRKFKRQLPNFEDTFKPYVENKLEEILGADVELIRIPGGDFSCNLIINGIQLAGSIPDCNYSYPYYRETYIDDCLYRIQHQLPSLPELNLHITYMPTEEQQRNEEQALESLKNTIQYSLHAPGNLNWPLNVRNALADPDLEIEPIGNGVDNQYDRFVLKLNGEDCGDPIPYSDIYGLSVEGITRILTHKFYDKLHDMLYGPHQEQPNIPDEDENIPDEDDDDDGDY